MKALRPVRIVRTNDFGEFIAVLATYSYDLTRLNLPERLHDLWKQRTEVIYVIARRHHDQDTDTKPR